jgi:hypothetical protein
VTRPLPATLTEPAPSTRERSAYARVTYPAALADHAALVDVASDPGEAAALVAETHAALVDPDGGRDLPAPSAIGAAVARALRAAPEWQALADVAAGSPRIAAEATATLAPAIRAALVRAQAGRTDGRGAGLALAAARARLERARAAAAAARAEADAAEAAADAVATDPAADDAALDAAEDAADAARAAADAAGRDAADAADAADRAGAACQAAGAVAGRIDATAGPAVAAAVAAAARVAGEAAADHAALAGCGLAAAMGADTPDEIPGDVVDALRGADLRALLRLVGALRAALRAGRATRHLPGRDGVVGRDVGGLDRIADLAPMTRAALAGHLGGGLASLAALRLVQGTAAIVDRGGGHAHRGHVAVVVDLSGSMEGARATWARALALAVVLEARAEHRAAAVVTYSGTVRGTALADTPAGMADAVRLLCAPASGGTATGAALAAALAALRQLPRSGDAADVLLVTDGDWTADAVAGYPTAPGSPRLRVVTVGGAMPPDVSPAVAEAWTVDVVEGAEGERHAVSIARAVV